MTKKHLEHEVFQIKQLPMVFLSCWKKFCAHKGEVTKNGGGEAAWEQLFEETEKQPTIEEQ